MRKCSEEKKYRMELERKIVESTLLKHRYSIVSPIKSVSPSN